MEKAITSKTEVSALVGNVDYNKLMQQAGQLILRDREGKPYTNEQRALVVLAAQQLGLNPILGHLTIIGDRLYITNAGLLHIAHSSGKLQGIKTRPAKEEERKAYFLGSNPRDIHLWRAEVYLKGQKEPYVGWGKASTNEKSWAVKSNPQEMAETRAVNRALRKAFNIAGYTSLEEIDEDNTQVIKETEEPITSEQIKMLHAVAGLIGKDFYEHQFKGWLETETGKESSTELTKSEASELIDRLIILLEDQLKIVAESLGIDFVEWLERTYDISSLTQTGNYQILKEAKEKLMKKRYRKEIIQMIQRIMKEKDLSPNDLKKMIKENFGAESSAELDITQLEKLLEIVNDYKKEEEEDEVPF